MVWWPFCQSGASSCHLFHPPPENDGVGWDGMGVHSEGQRYRPVKKHLFESTLPHGSCSHSFVFFVFANQMSQQQPDFVTLLLSVTYASAQTSRRPWALDYGSEDGVFFLYAYFGTILNNISLFKNLPEKVVFEWSWKQGCLLYSWAVDVWHHHLQLFFWRSMELYLCKSWGFQSRRFSVLLHPQYCHIKLASVVVVVNVHASLHDWNRLRVDHSHLNLGFEIVTGTQNMNSATEYADIQFDSFSAEYVERSHKVNSGYFEWVLVNTPFTKFLLSW